MEDGRPASTAGRRRSPEETLRALVELIDEFPRATMPSLRNAIRHAPDQRTAVRLLKDLIPQHERWAREEIGRLVDRPDTVAVRRGVVNAKEHS